MTYAETLDYLYSRLPMFQRIGPAALKKDLGNTIKLLAALGNPEQRWPSLHIAGTNGKGSSSHALAAILQAAGYKTGLYTSPHLKNFTERIRINGQEISPEFVAQWVSDKQTLIEEISPSFFEVTVALAFDYFARQEVDIAVIEVGLGGRLDSTNVIQPLLSLITNISLEHTALLGDTLEAIAGEKGGIIKSTTPVVIGSTQPESKPVFEQIAHERRAPITFADQKISLEADENSCLQVFYEGTPWLVTVCPELKASYFLKNLPGVLECIRQLGKDFPVSDEAIRQGLSEMLTSTGLKGRWQTLSENPRVIADISHNPEGLRMLMQQVAEIPHQQLHIVLGMVADKDIQAALRLLPPGAFYYFCQADIPRALAADELQKLAASLGLVGKCIRNVNEALDEARRQAEKEDLILVTGSAFVVAELNEL